MIWMNSSHREPWEKVLRCCAPSCSSASLAHCVNERKKNGNDGDDYERIEEEGEGACFHWDD